MNIASIAACRPTLKASVYAATKAYVKHLTKTLILEDYKNIHLSYLLLGPTNTDFWRRAK